MARYDKVNILKTDNDVPYYQNVIYPNIPLDASDIYVITTAGDRLDYLAYTYYKDSSLYWIISVANNNATKGSLFPVPGTQLRIPANAASVINLFNKFNQAR
jgi:LysM repeat protein